MIYAVLWLHVHTKDKSNKAAAKDIAQEDLDLEASSNRSAQQRDDGGNADDEQIPLTIELVLDMCEGYTGWTVSMDHFYMSPHVAVVL